MGKIKEAIKKIPLVVVIYESAKGCLSYINPNIRLSGTGGTNSARYCYSVWMRHLVRLHETGLKQVPCSMAEFGPGDSLGIGLSAMLSGVDRYYAFELVEFASFATSLPIFEELVDLFTKREPIPDNREFPGVGPAISDFKFPADILTEEVLERTLAKDRIEKIRGLLSDSEAGQAVPNDFCLKYIVPWENYQGEYPKVDLIISQAVFEHIDHLDNAYKVMGEILLPSAFMSHTIGFESHGYARKWNGHWGYSDACWRLIRGNRPYLINREPVSTHLTLAGENHFEMCLCEAETREGGIPYSRRSKRFANMSEEAFNTSSVYIVMQKRESSCA
jgi:hypothetical protein